MKNKFSLLLIITSVFSFFTQTDVKASALADTAALVIADSLNARSLIISEVMLANRQQDSWVYAEFANTGTTDLDLSHYFTWSTWHNNVWASEMARGHNRRITLNGTLAPGDVYLIVRREINNQEDPWGNLLYPNGYTNLEAEALADTVKTRQNPPEDLETFGTYSDWAEWRIGLCYINQITEFDGEFWPDSVFIDRFSVSKDDYPNGNADSENLDAWRFPIAGIKSSSPRRASVYVRKYGILKGNTVGETRAEDNVYKTVDWDQSRGTDLDDSEWIPLPRSMDTGYDKIFTTMGYHGPSPDLSITSAVATIDDTEKSITIPYGTSRDSVFRLFETGLNHAWELKLGADTGQFFVQEDDSLFFYTAGEARSLYKYGVKLDGAPAASALVAPLVYKNDNEAFVRNFDISNGVAPMDTIGTLPYDMPMDTLFAYTVKEEGATWEIIPADGQKRPEIKEGDILKVTSADKSTTKEYYLGVQEFFPDHDAFLSTIYFPGLEIFENPETYMPTDTLITFSQSVDFYTVNLDAEVKASPAIIAVPASSRSTVVVNRASDLKGSQEARTATITVTAEDDTTIMEYKILFVQERPAPPVKGSLFISDLGGNWTGHNHYNIQIFNPSDELVDLTDYAWITIPKGGKGSIDNSFANDSNWANNNKFILRPGYIIEPAEDGTPVYKTDLLQKTILLNSQEVYSMVSRGGYPMLWASPENQDKVDLVLAGMGGNATASSWSTQGWLSYANRVYGTADPYGYDKMLLEGLVPKLMAWGRNYLAIAKILNDSVKNGEKHVWDNFEEDYEIIDVFGGFSMPGAEVVLYDNDTITKMGNIDRVFGLTRKPHVFKGNPIDGLSWGLGETESPYTTYIPSEWDSWGFDETGGELPYDDPKGRNTMREKVFEAHVMITNAHIPYLTSATYLLEEGLIGPQDIKGVTSGTTVDQFLANVDKADTGMVIKVYDADKIEISGEDLVAAGTNVWSWSANGLDSVNYVINTLGALDNACTLSSTKYTVTTTAPTGVISGISIGTTLEQVLNYVDAPQTASINITDGLEQNIAMYKFDNDTIKHEALERVPVLASTKTYIEVVAQDKVTKCIYEMVFDAEEDPFILSDVYVVDEGNKVIDFVRRTSPEKLLANLIASPGASLKVVNKYDQERTIGIVEYSDRVIITKGDVSISYWLKFTENEEIIGVELDKTQKSVLSVYPNPTSDFVTISNVSGKYYEIRDLTGKLILKKSINSTVLNVDMRSLSKGVYILSVETNSKDYSFKVIKE